MPSPYRVAAPRPPKVVAKVRPRWGLLALSAAAGAAAVALPAARLGPRDELALVVEAADKVAVSIDRDAAELHRRVAAEAMARVARCREPDAKACRAAAAEAVIAGARLEVEAIDARIERQRALAYALEALTLARR